MVEDFGGGIEVDVKGGAAVVLEVGDERAAEGGLVVVNSCTEGAVYISGLSYLSCACRAHDEDAKLRHGV